MNQVSPSSTEDKEHFSIRDTKLIPKEEIRNYEREVDLPKPKDILDTSTIILWCTGSWGIILLNVAQCLVAIKDMLHSEYDPSRHGLSILIFVAALGSLVAIHQYIIKKD